MSYSQMPSEFCSTHDETFESTSEPPEFGINTTSESVTGSYIEATPPSGMETPPYVGVQSPPHPMFESTGCMSPPPGVLYGGGTDLIGLVDDVYIDRIMAPTVPDSEPETETPPPKKRLKGRCMSSTLILQMYPLEKMSEYEMQLLEELRGLEERERLILESAKTILRILIWLGYVG